MMTEPAIDIDELVRSSRARQGLPPTITDATTLRQIAACLVDAKGSPRRNGEPSREADSPTSQKTLLSGRRE
jgi:hypothetical protein